MGFLSGRVLPCRFIETDCALAILPGLLSLSGKKSFPDDLEAWLCSRTHIDMFTKEAKEIGVEVMGLCCHLFKHLFSAEKLCRHQTEVLVHWQWLEPKIASSRHDVAAHFRFVLREPGLLHAHDGGGARAEAGRVALQQGHVKTHHGAAGRPGPRRHVQHHEQTRPVNLVPNSSTFSCTKNVTTRLARLFTFSFLSVKDEQIAAARDVFTNVPLASSVGFEGPSDVHNLVRQLVSTGMVWFTSLF